MAKKFYISEVFAEGPYAGNQLATLPDAAAISSEEMQQIARAFNFPETTFITGGTLQAGFDVRIFTPNSELPFAGHPTLGTSFIIRNELLRTDAERINLNLGVGTIPVEFADNGVLWMTQKAPVFGETFDPAAAAAALGLDVSDVDQRFPCQRVSTGLEFILVPLASPQALSRASGRDGVFATGCLAFCAGGYSADQQIQARMFAAALGVSEDPATGSANGCLAAYLSEYQYFGSPDVQVVVGQGYEIARPSQLYLQASKRAGSHVIRVGGKVRLVARGDWLV